jgi:hypothetical protein
MNKVIEYLLNRLGESSTWRGIVLLLTALGVTLNPEQVASITGVGLGIVGLINVFRKSAGSPDAPKPVTDPVPKVL